MPLRPAAALPDTTILPDPLISPAKLADRLELLIWSVLVPRLSDPDPDSDPMVAPDVVEAMFSVPATATPDELAMLPDPDNASVAPEAIEVAPV